MTRGILRVRLVAVALTILSLATTGPSLQPLTIALVVAMAVSVVPLLSWERIGPVLLRHPMLLVLDALVALGVLLVAGPQSPFFYFTLGTAALGGLLYHWVGASLFSLIMLAGYALVAMLAQAVVDVDPTFHNMIGIPALYPIVGALGAGIRGLLDRQAATEAELAEANSVAAATEERGRLARELHDSLGKTLHGIQLAAATLPHRVASCPERAVTDAEQIASAAMVAAGQARQLISDLRVQDSTQALHSELSSTATEWATEQRVALDLSVDDVGPFDPAASRELLGIAREALRNVERHARATRVRLDLCEDDGDAVLRITDDGVGFVMPSDLSELADRGHFGMVGLQERASRAGGALHVRSSPGDGTTVAVRLPRPATRAQP